MTINYLGKRPEGNREKKISEALLQEKINFQRHSPGKNKFSEALSRKKLILRGSPQWKKIFEHPSAVKNKF